MSAAIAATAARDERTNAEKSVDEDMAGLVIVTTIAANGVAAAKINDRSEKQSSFLVNTSSEQRSRYAKYGAGGRAGHLP